MKNILLFIISLSIYGQKPETVQTRFKPPMGYERTAEPINSFGYFLRNLSLKPKSSVVKHFDGSLKSKSNVYDAVVDLPIGNRDLHQCADAVMRLRADYFYSQKQFENIHFNFTNGFKAEYSRWRNGERIKVNGNQTTWIRTTKLSKDDASYWKYLEQVFTYAGTASLSKELKISNLQDLKIGDVFIKGGFPGHAVIVIDVAVQKQSKKKIFLLAQSYMPAQEIQILKNNNNASLSPWYSADFEGDLQTPEWTFTKAEFKKF
jgi:Domain of unknown function (4846)